MTDDRIKGVWLASHPIYYTKKGEANVKNKFKAGDLVFELDFHGGIKLKVLKGRPHQEGDFHELSTRYGFNYSRCGRAYPSFKVPHLLHATPEVREKLVAIWGEDAVPKLPLRGSELTKRLLEKQEYVICFCSDTNDDDCRENKRPVLIRFFKEGYFYNREVDSPFADTWKHAIPVDNNGNEITEIEE